MSTRMAAAARREALIDVACGTFARSSYRGTTTKAIAAEAGVTEPILYRHFPSKRDLYLACLDAAWARVQALWETALADEPDPGAWLQAMGVAYLAAKDKRTRLVDLWIQALSEASDDPVIRRSLRRQIREVHEYVQDVIERAQAAGGIISERDPSAEAWVFISIGLLGTIDRRLSMLDGELTRIVASRRAWMTGVAPAAPRTQAKTTG
jgi:TetR/AcrR family transcriptional regulator